MGWNKYPLRLQITREGWFFHKKRKLWIPLNNIIMSSPKLRWYYSWYSSMIKYYGKKLNNQE